MVHVERWMLANHSAGLDPLAHAECHLMEVTSRGIRPGKAGELLDGIFDSIA